MPISSFTTEIPRRLETLKRISLDFTLQTVDGDLSHLSNTSGKIVATFPLDSPRHTTEGKVTIQQGNAVPVLTIDPADVRIEQGADEPGWPGVILGAIVVTGFEQGVAWAGRSTGPVGETSLGYEMAISDANGKKAQQAELKTWLASGGPLAATAARSLSVSEILPHWAEVWLEEVGLVVEDFERIFSAAAAKFDAPAEVVDAVSTWVEQNVKVKVSSQYVVAVVTAVVVAVKTGISGYDQDASLGI